jgi:two-component system sensor histidine kinase YesM
LIQTFIAKQEADQKLAAEKLLRKESSLLALQSQINPHFLYNTLDAINWESIDQLGIGNPISKMLLCLSSNLRYITRKTDRLVSLQEELNNLEQYITLHKLSTSNKVSFDIDVDKQLLDRSVPVLLLQPLVENAINHGLSNTPDGFVKIRIAESNDKLLIEIQDNGCGFTSKRLQEIQTMLDSGELTGNDSLGIKNVDGRLKLLYGPECGLHIQSAPDCGCCIQILLPPQ